MICTELGNSVLGIQDYNINEVQRECEFLIVSQVSVPLIYWQSGSRDQKLMLLLLSHLGKRCDQESRDLVLVQVLTPNCFIILSKSFNLGNLSCITYKASLESFRL